MIGILYINSYWYLAEKVDVGQQACWYVLDLPLNGFPDYADAVAYRGYQQDLKQGTL
jgi:hypothetical protein